MFELDIYIMMNSLKYHISCCKYVNSFSSTGVPCELSLWISFFDFVHLFLEGGGGGGGLFALVVCFCFLGHPFFPFSLGFHVDVKFQWSSQDPSPHHPHPLPISTSAVCVCAQHVFFHLHRGISFRKQRGGNASNNCTVLSQLSTPCEYLGVLPPPSDPEHR